MSSTVNIPVKRPALLMAHGTASNDVPIIVFHIDILDTIKSSQDAKNTLFLYVHSDKAGLRALTVFLARYV